MSMTAEDQQKLKDAIETLGKATNEYKTTLDQRGKEIETHGRELGETKSKLEKLEKALADADAVKQRLENLELSIKRGTGGGRGDLSDTDVKAAERDRAIKSAFDSFIRGEHGDGKLMKNNPKIRELIEKKTMLSNSDADGGYFVMPDQTGRMVSIIRESSPIRQMASVQTISSDAYEGGTDLDETDVDWEGEVENSSSEATPQFGKWRIEVFRMGHHPKISQDLIDDANIDVEALLLRKSADKFARAEATVFCTGTGVKRPRGFLTYANGTGWGQIEQKETASSGVLLDTELIDLIHKLKGPYRARAQFAMSRLTLAEVRKLKDDNGQMIWQPGLQLGQPSSLLGYPVREFADMPDFAAGALSIAFADWAEFYQIVDRAGLSVLRDPFTANPLVKFHIRRRVGGDVVNFEAGKLLKIKA